MTVSPLSSKIYSTENCGNFLNGKHFFDRVYKIEKITVHHMAGVFSLDSVARAFADPKRQASSNYGIDNDGKIACFVPEDVRAWTSGSYDNDNRAVTIEVANESYGHPWKVSDKAFDSLCRLVLDVCKRNGIKKLVYTGDASGNLTLHRFFQNTVCPGPYLESMIPLLVSVVNSGLEKGCVEPAAQEKESAPEKREEKAEEKKDGRPNAVYRVRAGSFKNESNADRLIDRLEREGFDCVKIAEDGLFKIQAGAFKDKNNANSLVKKLKDKGFAAFVVSTVFSSPSSANGESGKTPEKDTETLAKEVIRGLWGVGLDRKNRLVAAGYDYDEVQSAVNRMMR